MRIIIFSCLSISLISSSPVTTDASYDEHLNSKSNNHNLDPFWENPCGVLPNASETLNTEDVNATHYRSLRKIRQHLKMALQYLTGSNSIKIFLNTRKGLSRENYSPNWIPDIDSVKPILESNGVRTIDHYEDKLSVLHSDLQKFAVAFEKIQMDEPVGTDRKACLTVLIEYLRELLCEVESTIIELGENVPETIPRTVMSADEKKMNKKRSSSEISYISLTEKMIRDNGILLKYKEFLDAWLRVYKIARRTKSNSVH